MADKTEEERRRRRLEKQRAAPSAGCAAEKAKKRTPERDDFGRELLHFAITENLRLNREGQNVGHHRPSGRAAGRQGFFDRAETNRSHRRNHRPIRGQAGASSARLRLAGSAETEDFLTGPDCAPVSATQGGGHLTITSMALNQTPFASLPWYSPR